MKNLIFCLFLLLSFFCFSLVCNNTVVNGNKQSSASYKKRALLVGIGNYLPEGYKNEYKEIRNLFEGNSNAVSIRERFEEFCSAENIDKSCARFLNNPNETTASEFAEIKNFYELIQKKKCPEDAAPSICREPKAILAGAKNLYGDFILRKRNVSVDSFNLREGPHNDVLNMARILALKFEFDEIYVLLDKTPALRDKTEKEINKINEQVNRFFSRKPIVLLGEVPTNEVIKNTFKQKLTESAQTCVKINNNCDKSLFYFSGHGSQRRNPSEENERDETLVTLDVLSGKPDLRDKELAELYNAALEKSDLTVITDSCHSGDNYKAVFFDISKAKAISNDPRPVTESEQKKVSNPIENGLLWFGASKRDETAKSVPGLPDLFDDKANGKQQGNFTHHFVKTLMSVNDMTALEAFERTKSIMPVKIPQTPVADGFERNKNVNFFGGAINLRSFNATRKGESLFTINGGRLYGLRAATRLQSEDRKICLEIKVARLTESDATYCKENQTLEILATTLLYQTTWATPSDEDALKFWIPPAAPQKDINLILEKFGKYISTDAAKEFSHILYFNVSGNNWQFCPVGNDCQSYQSDSLPFKENDLALFIHPVENAFRKKLEDELAKLNFGVKIVGNLAQSDYFLLGDNVGNKYAWLNRSAIKWQNELRKVNPNESSMPLITRYEPIDLKSDQSNLAELVQTLGKMHSWITLKLFSPPPVEEKSPKLIVSKNDKTITTDAVITKGSRLRFSTASSGQKKEIPTKFFYLISFNEKGAMNFENESSDDKCAEKDCFLEEVLSVPENFGNKTLILLTTDKRIFEASGLFNASGVKAPYKNPLVSLISQMQSGKKDAGGSSTFQNWSVDIFHLKFEAKKP